MNITGGRLTALHDLGYAEAEARFLYLVATHSGYFTRRQFLAFTNHPKGKYIQQFTEKTLSRRHARATEYGKQTYIFNLYARRLYGALDRENLRNRRRHSAELIHTRLLILDFVLAHPDRHYLEAEADKVSYFHQQLGLPLPILPGRIYRGLRPGSNTKRYFVDRFPIFLASGGTPSFPPLVTFTFCDSGDHSLARYVTHLRSYETFLRRLPAFNFIYAAPDPQKFPRAARFFAQLFAPNRLLDGQHLARYFQVRALWDTHRDSLLTRADRELLRDGDHRYQAEPFESVYKK